jgi:hypothetical protein
MLHKNVFDDDSSENHDENSDENNNERALN